MEIRSYIIGVAAATCSALPFSHCFAWEGNVLVSTPHTSMLLHAGEGQDLRFAYFGDRIEESQIHQIHDAWDGLNRTAYPTFGQPPHQIFALQAVHADGNWTTDLTVENVETSTLDNAKLTAITLKDKVYPFQVKLYYKAYNDIDMIETWSEISHTEKKTVVLKRFDSGHFLIRRGDVWVSHLHGSWAAETHVTTEPLTPGIKMIENVDGARNGHLDHPEVMFSLDGKPRENEGRVIGAALCWSGNYAIRMVTDNNFVHRVFAGIDSESSEYKLAPEEVFTTPKLALTYSGEGLSGASRNFHRWARHAGMLRHGNQVRPVLLNSWEGVYLDVNEPAMAEMMKDIATLGGELFVMDDGWFGDKYRRVQDNSSLGDWVVDQKKLPHGIEGLIREADKNGIKFGIWIEPEAVNSKSELFEKHPDWALQVKERPLQYGRGGTQMLLDVCNPKVQDFMFGIVDNLLSRHPQIAYIKWDANVELKNYGSTYLPKDKQSHIYIEYHRGLNKVLERIRAKGVTIVPVTLHVGLGTFRPVQVEDVDKHVMHSEWYQVTEEAANTLNAIRAGGGRLICVGTTSVRTIETVATEDGIVHPGAGDTAIFIYPGKKIKAVDALITNFHLPQSTLLMLVSTFMGRETALDVYREAVQKKYRFFSFGDAMFIE